jgi:hypothetical protein
MSYLTHSLGPRIEYAPRPAGIRAAETGNRPPDPIFGDFLRTGIGDSQHESRRRLEPDRPSPRRNSRSGRPACLSLGTARFAFNGNREHVRTHHPERCHCRGPGLGCVAGVRWYGTRPRPLLRATYTPLPGSHSRTVLCPAPSGTVLRPGPAVRPRLAGLILNFRDRAVGNPERLGRRLNKCRTVPYSPGRPDPWGRRPSTTLAKPTFGGWL